MKHQALISLCVALLVFSCNNKKSATPDPVNTQLITEVKAIDAHLAASGVSDYIFRDDKNGVRYVIHKFGEGALPRSGQTVNFNYTSTVFKETTILGGSLVNTTLENVRIVGLTPWIPNLQAGSIVSVYVPSKYAYGNIQNSIIPANTPIVYSVSFSGISKTPAQLIQFDGDTSFIRDSLNKYGIINLIKDKTGIFYTVNTQGSGSNPKIYSAVTIYYKLRLLSSIKDPDGVPIEENNLNGIRIIGLVDGLIVGLPKMNEGSTVTFYIPSGLGYGTSSTNSKIPANSNLIFEIKLNRILQ